MTTRTEVANLALSLMGSRASVADLDTENSREAKECRLWYDVTRDDLLSKSQWNFGYTAITMSLLKSAPGTPTGGTATNVWQATSPLPPWNYAYAYPPDCIRTDFVIPQGYWASLVASANTTNLWPLFSQCATPFKVAMDTISGNKQKVILTNAEQAILIYQARAPENLWDATFTKAVASALAASIAPQLSGDKATMELNAKAALFMLNEARARDANDGITIQDITPSWIAARDSVNWQSPYGPL